MMRLVQTFRLFSPFTGGSGPKRFLGNAWVDGGWPVENLWRQFLWDTHPPSPFASLRVLPLAGGEKSGFGEGRRS